MKIGIDCRMYGPSFTGIGRYVYELVQHLAAITNSPLFLKEGSGEIFEFICFLNPAEYKTFVAPGPNVRAVRVEAKHYSVAEQTSFLSALMREQLDLMHFTHFNAPLLYPRPSVVTIHDLTLSIYPGQKMTKLIHRAAYNLVIRSAVWHARQIIAVSENTKRDITHFLGTKSDKITTALNGMSTDFHPAKDRAAVHQRLAGKYGLRGDFLLYTGVWRDHKNLLGLIESLAILKRESLSIQLVITGKTDPIYAPAIYKKIEQLGLQDDVVFVGLVPEEDLLALYQAARVYVFPSFYEGFGLPPLEAMAAGTPVAVSRASCMPEVCGAGNAVYFDPADPADMARAIREAATDETLRGQLIKNGLAHVRTFSWEKMARETLAVYRQALGK